MTATDLENLNGSQIAAVVDAIRLSFDEAQFAMLLRRRLNKALADLAEPDTWPERVFRAVEESQKQGFGGKLIDAIEIERPDTERITSLRQRLAELQKSTIASDGDPPMPAETNSTASLSASGKIPVVPDRDRGSHTGRWTEAPQAFQTWMLGLLIALLVVVVALVVYDRASPRELTIEEYDKLLDQARNEVKKENPKEEGQVIEDKAKEKVASEQGQIAIATKFWPNSTVPYVIAADVSVKDNVLAAIAEYQGKTNLRFIERTAKNASGYPNYVVFGDGQGCTSYVGVQGGEQKLIVGSMCDLGAILHEIGHTIGLYHENSRPDRDNYIKINWENIIGGYARSFNIVQSSVNQRRPYDYESIMHFPSTAFSINGNPTMEPLLSTARIGPMGHLSPGDIMLINAIYLKPSGGS